MPHKDLRRMDTTARSLQRLLDVATSASRQPCPSLMLWFSSMTTCLQVTEVTQTTHVGTEGDADLTH